MTPNLVVVPPAALPVTVVPVPADRNPYHVYLASLASLESRRTMSGCLKHIAQMLAEVSGQEITPEAVPWGSLRFQHGATIKARLLQATHVVRGEVVPLAPSYINSHLAALRGVLKAAFNLGYLTADDHARARDALKNVTGSRLPSGRNLADAEQAAMLGVCLDGTLIGIRNAAIVALLCATGSRRAEIAAARREHYDPGQRALRIVGKGNKQREVYVNEDAAVYLGAWLAQLDGRTGPMFVPIDRWGHPAARHMSTRAVGEIIDKIRREAKLPPLTTHDFRRTFIGALLDDGADLATAQALAGHASPVTTAGYDRRPAATRRAAANRLRLPRPEDLKPGV